MVSKPLPGVAVIVDVVVHAVAMPQVVRPLPWKGHTKAGVRRKQLRPSPLPLPTLTPLHPCLPAGPMDTWSGEPAEGG